MKKPVLFLSCCLVLCTSVQAKHRKSHWSDPIVEAVDESLVQAPVDQEVCFSPDGHCDIKLAKLIRTAKKSIDVAIFDINLDQVVNELLLQSKKIPVRFLVDMREAKTHKSSVPFIMKAGGNLRYGKQRGIMHNKFIIIDGTMMMLGSFNFTNGASHKNQENQLYLANPAIIEKYQTHYSEMFQKGLIPHDRN